MAEPKTVDLVPDFYVVFKHLLQSVIDGSHGEPKLVAEVLDEPFWMYQQVVVEKSGVLDKLRDASDADTRRREAFDKASQEPGWNEDAYYESDEWVVALEEVNEALFLAMHAYQKLIHDLKQRRAKEPKEAK